MTGLSPLAVTTLGLLVERDMHPYEMFGLILERRQDRVVRVSAGSLYRTVEKLAAAGFAEVVGTQRAGNRPERTTYRITETGREQLRRHVRELLRHPSQEYPTFVLGLTEAHNVPLPQVVDDLRRHLSDLDAEIEEVEATLHRKDVEATPEAYIVNLRFIHHMRGAERDYVSTLLATLDRQDKDQVPWP